jgi:hypothetical protein
MDPTSHIPPVVLFYYLNNGMPLTQDENEHLRTCSVCQSVVDDFNTYIDPGMIHAA